MSPAPHHGPHPLLFFMVVLVSVNQCFFHRELIVCPALSEASSFIEFMQLCSLVIQAHVYEGSGWITSLQPTLSVGRKTFQGFFIEENNHFLYSSRLKEFTQR